MMRRPLKDLGTPDHLGLAYEAWAPVGDDGKVPEDKRSDWLARIAAITVSRDYAQSFERWKNSFTASGDRVFELELASRLLVGHANSSATDVGLTVHHTWGVPVIPGSALKGLTAKYVDAVYGPSNPERRPWEQEGEERARVDYQGVTWCGRHIERGPGAVYRALFGAPEAEQDAAMRDRGFPAGASRGRVIFHDALYVPGSSSDHRPFAPDVLTVHQKSYYNTSGGTWPNDYDSPNPVAFLTVRPGTRFLFALSGPGDWTELAERLIRQALQEWGVGAKTSGGYGRLVAPGRPLGGPQAAGERLRGTTPRPGDRVDATLLEERTRKGGWKARYDSSGLSGPIQNSGNVPAEARPGDRVSLIVAFVTEREIAFRFPTPGEMARGTKGRRGK